MKRADRKTIGNIIAVHPYIYGWQDEIEKEQEIILGDLVSPAKKLVEALIALDNRRIDLCNINVLFGYIERGLGGSFYALTECAAAGIDSPLFERARAAILNAGYDLSRVREEFDYLFRRIEKPKKKKPGFFAYGIGNTGACVTGETRG